MNRDGALKRTMHYNGRFTIQSGCGDSGTETTTLPATGY